MTEIACQWEEHRIRSAYAKRRDLAPYSWFRPDYRFILQRREQRVLALLQRFGFAARLAETTVFEVGCGNGQWLRDFIKWGAVPENLAGIDLLSERVQSARQKSPADVRLHCGSATELPYPDDSFDLVLQSTVFTSILDAELKQKIAQEMIRLVRPDGLVVWYDFRLNNPRNPDVRGVGRAEIQRLFPGCRVQLESVTLAPPVTRRIVPISFTAACLLESIPWLRSHYLGAIQKSREVSER